MTRRYNPQEIEAKWQKAWENHKLYEIDTSDSSKKFYVIPMFPYPSGDLHIGHWYNFAPTDVVARWRRMQGHRVLHAIGFDAFGLPAENAAIKRNIPPAQWTKDNVVAMTKQLKAIGASYDWTKLVNTSDPSYYRWTQWIFLKLFEKKLAYRAKGTVNWCPKDQTVLANEQVIGENNECERCGTPVEQKQMEQWYFKTTDYAERLLKDLDDMDWPERVKLMQANWIGKSQGALIDFELGGSDGKISVFTTRPDTIFGATYLVVAPEHPIASKLTPSSQKSEVESYVDEAVRKTELERKEGEKDKTGVFTGSYAINPVNGEKIPIWIADYVLMGYGTGAIMAVPAHDERDWQFTKKYNLPIVHVYDQLNTDSGSWYNGEGLIKNSASYDGMTTSQMREKIVADLSERGIAKEETNYRLHDWLVSRQRYWGPPIPVVYCDKCGIQPVPEKDLPVLLPEDVHFQPTGQSPLKQSEDFVNTRCPKCDGPAQRETDTLDTFVDSSWYFLRYPNPNHKDGPYDLETITDWGPVDHYIGGIEHAILHLMYARFITMFLHDHYSLPFEEPFKKLSNQGIILGPDGHKMSKSRGNVVSPDEQVVSYGADSLRLYLMFMGPYDQGGPYSMGGITGTRRFLERVWSLVEEFTASQPGSANDEKTLTTAVHRTIKSVSQDLDKLAFNTAIASMMSLVNDLYGQKATHGISASPVWRKALENLVVMLAPFAPHITEELWKQLGNKESVHLSKWPVWDEEMVKEDTITLAVQVNGKVRAEISVDASSSESQILTAAKTDEAVKKHLDGKNVKKEIVVPGRLVSLVTD